MANAFDQIAKGYDAEFGQTAVGSLLRKRVWDYLDKMMDHNKKLAVLELNCGTGDDAIWLAAKGHHVMATDVSEKMLEVASLKAKNAGLEKEIAFLNLDIANPVSYPTNKKFDLVFSNFGGLNCISPDSFKKAIPGIAQLLNPKGHFIAVVMPKFCLWESVYFTLKGQFSKIFRRNQKKSLQAPVGDAFVETWYYSPMGIRLICKPDFKAIKTKAVGIFLPPSYLNNYFEKHSNQLQLLYQFEKLFSGFSPTAAISDHFLIDMEVKS